MSHTGTSTVPAAQSIAYIEAKLAQHRATMIIKMYSPEGKVEAIAFEVEVHGMKMPFRLPAQLDACARTLKANLPLKARPETIAKIGEQAERTAWKIVADWIDAQLAMIELAQVELLEVFLPYVYDPHKKQTYFESIKARGFKGLLPAGQE